MLEAPRGANASNEDNAAINGGTCASAPTTFHLRGFSSLEPNASSTAMIAISR